eukprot:806757-Ditylum_brightwellii.AAC.1
MKLSLDSAALLLLCDGSGWKKEEEEKKIHSQVKKLVYTQLAGEEMATRIKYIDFASLVPVYCSPWHKLFYSGDESFSSLWQ